MTDLILVPGMTVLISAFDEVPEHHFEIEAVFDDCVTGYAITGPLAGEYGEPDIELIVEVISAP
ncbi:hypothetical protein [Donghicola eburneus]|uniref:Uncharacterized protein n=1 Tax=Donghicola eburneus TaxID=393278 RepID=A0A1M4N3M2_9RHOB|nr:hypothetical protein [Donghicola eburneus]SCM69431.1 hypothetical protein KARMA_3670 [Donghicola eburneus]